MRRRSLRALQILLPLLLILIALTSFYGVAYIVATFGAAKMLRFSKTFSTIFGRIVLASLLLAMTIMVAGLAVWYVGMPVHPVFILLLFALIVIWIRHSQQLQRLKTPSPKFIDRGDIISLFLALIAPVIIMLSFQIPSSSNVGLYQFLHSGWDNASHLSMLETAALEKGYVYGNYEDVKEKTILKSNAYPQAWHLATSHIANGFGINAFTPLEPIVALQSYTAVLFAWYIIAVYSFSRLAWRVLLSSTKELKTTWTRATLFIAASLFVQLVLFWGSLTSAFVNYIGCIAYLTILASMLMDKNPEEWRPHYVTALLAGVGASLSWFLPLPAIIMTVLLGFVEWNKLSISLIKKSVVRQWSLILASFAAIAIVLAQVYIFTIYSQISGADQLNAGKLGGAFSIGQLLLAITAVSTLFYWHYKKQGGRASTGDKIISIVTPMLILTSIIYVYQILSGGELSYYFGKSAGLAFAMVGIFFVPAFTHWVLSFQKINNISPINTLVIGVSILGALVFGTNQPTISFSKLFETNSLVSKNTAQEVIKYLKDEDPAKTKLVILRDEKNYEDRNGNLAAKVAHLPLTCAATVVDSENVGSLEAKVASLGTCATSLNINLLVITSDKTKSVIHELNHHNIQTVNVP